MTDVVYVYGGKVYLNITNQCPCNCTFCIRQNGEGVGSAATLWHHGDPTETQVLEALSRFDFSPYDEITFCGYGEPTCALAVLKSAAAALKQRYPHIPLRVNTNGLGNLINGRGVETQLAACVDAVSVSLNAPTAERYMEVTRPRFGAESFGEVQRFAQNCQKVGLKVTFTVVDVLPPQEIEACRRLAAGLNIPFRVREYTP